MWLQGFVIIQDISKRLFVPCVVGKVWFGAQATVNILYMLSKTVVTNIKCVLVCCMPVCRFVNSRALRSEPSSCSCMCRGCRSHHLHWDATRAKKTEKCTLTFQRAEETLMVGLINTPLCQSWQQGKTAWFTEKVQHELEAEINVAVFT